MTSAYDWIGRVGETWASEWQRTDRAFAALTGHLDAAILAGAPTGAFRAADIGCGAGSTSLALARSRPDAMLTGIDLSAQLLAVARQRLAAQANFDVRLGDATEITRHLAPLDMLVSRHGVMFFPDPVAAFVDLRAACRPGAALVFSCFRDRAANAWASALVEQVTGAAPVAGAGYAPGPFGFADPVVTAAILRDAGWTVDGETRIDFDYVAGLGADPVADAAAFFRRIGPLAALLKQAADPDALDARLKAVLERYRTGTVVAFRASAWIWRAYA